MSKSTTLTHEISKRILVLDGGFGTMVQGYNLCENDYRGERFATWPTPLKGCNDLLVMTAPNIVGEIHSRYLEAGADIIETCSFNANAVSLADYGLAEYAYEMAREAARVARAAADKYTTSECPRFVAGSMGPTNRTSSIASDLNNPAAREISFDRLEAAYYDQARGLWDGGVDALLVETVFDTLNCKAALKAIDRLATERGERIPTMVSLTLSESGRTLSGQTIEAFYNSVSHAELVSIGFNCAFGARQLLPYLEELNELSEFAISVHPNAGLPNLMGGYDETPQMFADDVEEYLRRGLVNIVGGCCGTTPEHIRLVAGIVNNYSPRITPARRGESTASGLEGLTISHSRNFVNVGERTNVAGSAKFARLIREEDYDAALTIARSQVEAGAQVVDVCMDDGMIDGVRAMTTFLNIIASDPETARVPVMIDSSKWEVLEAGLKVTQGKSIVNSISLKEGEQEFLRKAREIHSYGAMAVVMLFDERGQADTYARKVEVAERAYRLLTEAGFPAADIIFDPNILAVATGIEAHNCYGVDFIEATRWIKQNLPGAKVSGGVSNLSFSFRGNNPVREAMHSVFLYHAIEAGMDMGIVNPAMLQIYSQIEPTLLTLCEDVVLNRREDATERLAEYAEQLKGQAAGASNVAVAEAWREGSIAERIDYAMLKGNADHIAEDAMEALQTEGSPLAVIDNLLMPAMTRVGELFGEGKMFLPQVVKSARVMKRAVEVLTPYIEQGGEAKAAGRFLIATVKGDVHDIGKNIVSVVAACNGYKINDLGVMVETERIVDEAVSWGADVIGLSGLITPSLDEMIKVVRELERRGLQIPVVVGGATTSELHTAVKMAPEYSGLVMRSRDASSNIQALAALTGADRESFIAAEKERQQQLRDNFERLSERKTITPIEECRRESRTKRAAEIVTPRKVGRTVLHKFEIENVEPYINWNYLLAAWQIKGRYPEVLESADKGEEARKVMEDARAMLEQIKKDGSLQLNGVVGIYPANREGDDIVVTCKGKQWRLAQLRNQTSEHLSVADYVTTADEGTDYVGVFALTGGVGLKELAAKYREAGDEYSAIMAKLLADRLTEAFAEVMHAFVREVTWGYQNEAMSPEEAVAEKYVGRRYAFGYPATPDHTLKREVFEMLDVEMMTGMHLTENCMIEPGEALCGLLIADPTASYFGIGIIDDEQVEDYARRRGTTSAEIRKYISQI
ncbi:MAG: methionine synthase [Rikenellaceae bacterium]|nr:methionine synthase [Rikenellaceae bacterium]